MKLFKTTDIAIIDQYTIEHEPIADIDLMERAAQTIVHYMVHDTDYSGLVLIFCGPGNNGGDGLAVARLLAEHAERYQIQVYLYSGGRTLTKSALMNLKRLETQHKTTIIQLVPSAPLPEIDQEAIIVDALFGSGLNRPLDGYPALLVKHLNQSGAEILSIDIPSGLMGEDNRQQSSRTHHQGYQNHHLSVSETQFYVSRK
jgi:ADP-dependent NAD(P)H-hydrate dehydratase / NAD(P)H-hydrate epimerase